MSLEFDVPAGKGCSLKLNTYVPMLRCSLSLPTSAGITLIELATGCFPYPKWNSVFEQLQQVVHGDPPRLDPSTNGKFFTIEFVNFVNTCLIKDETQRPKYTRLLGHDFIVRSDSERVDVADYVTHILERYDAREGMDDEDAAAEQPMDCMTTGS